MTGRARLISGELVDRATAYAAVTALEKLLDMKVWSVIHPDLKSVGDGFYDYPTLRRGAVSQARQLLAGEIPEITKPIIVEVLRHIGLFKAGANKRLIAAEVADDDTRNTVLAAVTPNYQGQEINFNHPIKGSTLATTRPNARWGSFPDLP